MQLEEDIICLKVKILQDLEHITGVKTLMDLNTQSVTDQKLNYRETSQDQETTIQIITKQNHEQESLALEQAKETVFRMLKTLLDLEPIVALIEKTVQLIISVLVQE